MEKDLTKGSISKQIIKFALPLLLGNVFQLTYNAADSIIIGKYVGIDAQAAVGTAGPVMNFAVLGISGICIGASVLMSKYYGKKDYQALKKSLSTTLLAGIVLSIVLLITGLVFMKALISILKVPDGIIYDASVYLRIIFIGLPFVLLYNIYSSAMRSVGDSKTPLMFLVFSSMLNVVFDLFFIIILELGTAGAAVGTLLSQIIAGVFCAVYVNKRIEILKLKREEISLDKSMLRIILRYGLITALQQSCQPVGKLMIQGSVNSIGVEAMAAFNAAGRVDDFVLLPEQNVSHAMMTFISQNRGAGNDERVRKGLEHGLRLEICLSLIMCALVLIFRKEVTGLFIKDNESAAGMAYEYLTCMAAFYVLPSISNGLQGYFRGMGHMGITLISTLIQISIRVLFVFLFIDQMGITTVAYASFAGWSLMLVFQIPMALRIYTQNGRRSY